MVIEKDFVCASPVISGFLCAWNARLDDAKRQLLKPYALRVVGTAAAKDVEDRRAWLAADWLIRTYLPTWLDLAGLAEDARAIRARPEITGVAMLPGLVDVEQKAAATSARAAMNASTCAVWSAAKHAAGRAVLNAIFTAIECAVWRAVNSVAMSRVERSDMDVALNWYMSTAKRAAIHATMSVALSAAARANKYDAKYVALNALSPTAERLQQSAFELLDRMIAVR